MGAMDGVLAKIQELIEMANATTGEMYANLYDAVKALIAGYGDGDVCLHPQTETTYRNNGNGTHYFETKCKVCGEILASGTENCVDKNADGICDLCNVALPQEPECDHETVVTSYSKNDDGTHTVTRRCKICGEILETRIEECNKIDVTIKDNGNETHTVTTTCSACGYVHSVSTESCEDENGDGKCDVCSAQMPTVPDDDAVWEYKQGELKSESGKKFYVDGGVLSLTGISNYVALGANGTTIQAIPIPASATKLTLTFGETGTKKVQFLFFTGSPTNATDPVDGYSADVVDGVCTFEGAGAEYVVFNCTGSWTTIQKQQVGSLATLKFE